MPLMCHKNHKQIHSLLLFQRAFCKRSSQESVFHKAVSAVQITVVADKFSISLPSHFSRLVNSSSPFFKVSVYRKLVIWSSSFVNCFEKNYHNHATTTSFVCETGSRCFSLVSDGVRLAHGVLDSAVLLEPLTASLVHLDE